VWQRVIYMLSVLCVVVAACKRKGLCNVWRCGGVLNI